MAVQGIFASDQHIVSNRVGDFASQILRIWPTGSAPLFALSSGMESIDAKDTVVNWFEETHLAGRKAIVSFVTDGDGVGHVLDDASEFQPGTILLNEERGDYALVTAVDVATNTITVIRNIDSQGAVTWVTSDNLQRVGTAYEEGSGKPVAVANVGSLLFNFTQIFRNSWDATGTAQAVAFHTGSVVAKNRADAGMFHAEDIERAFLWGRRGIGVLNNKPFRLANGIYSLLSTNVAAAGGTTSYAQLDTFFQAIFGKNIRGKPNERIAFTGNKGLSVLNAIALKDTTMFIEPGETQFGIKVSRWITPYGTVSLMTHPLFTESAFRTGDLLILHPGAIRTRWLRRTHLDLNDKDGTRAGADSNFGVFTSELSFQYTAEITGGIRTGLTAAA